MAKTATPKVAEGSYDKLQREYAELKEALDALNERVKRVETVILAANQPRNQFPTE